MVRVQGGDKEGIESDRIESDGSGFLVVSGYFTEGMGWGEEQGRLIWGVKFLLFFFLFNILD